MLEEEYVSWEAFVKDATQFYHFKSQLDTLCDRPVERENLEQLVKFYSNYADYKEDILKLSEPAVLLLEVIKSALKLNNKRSLLYSIQQTNVKNKGKLMDKNTLSVSLERKIERMQKVVDEIESDLARTLNETTDRKEVIEKYGLIEKFKLVKKENGEWLLKIKDRYREEENYLEVTLERRKVEVVERKKELLNKLMNVEKSRNVNEPEILPNYYTKTIKEQTKEPHPVMKQEKLVIEGHEPNTFKCFCCN